MIYLAVERAAIVAHRVRQDADIVQAEVNISSRVTHLLDVLHRHVVQQALLEQATVALLSNQNLVISAERPKASTHAADKFPQMRLAVPVGRDDIEYGIRVSASTQVPAPSACGSSAMPR